MGGNGRWSKSVTEYKYIGGLIRGWQCFDIPLAEYYVIGKTVTHVIFVNMLRNPPEPYVGRWTNIEIRSNDACASALDFTELPVMNLTNWGPTADDYIIKQSGCTLEVAQTTWKAFELDQPTTITSSTSLSFCFELEKKCSAHAISVTNDRTKTGTMFMISGWNAAWTGPHRDFEYQANYKDVQCFEIPLSQYLAVGSEISYIGIINTCDDPSPRGAIWSKVNLQSPPSPL